MRREWWSTVGVAAALLIGVAAAVAAGGVFASAARGGLSNRAYAHLWRVTRLGQPKAMVLQRWPGRPYEHYSDNFSDDCYEWADRPVAPYRYLPAHLYNLCFRDGLVASKDVF
jgi:hypothetical protein